MQETLLGPLFTVGLNQMTFGARLLCVSAYQTTINCKRMTMYYTGVVCDELLLSLLCDSIHKLQTGNETSRAT